MDTSSPHAHPTRYRRSKTSDSLPSRHSRSLFHATSPAVFTPSPQHEASVQPHQRRLQLRNSAFGTQLSAQRLGARFSRIFYDNEEPQAASAQDRQQENRSPYRASQQSTASSHSLNSSSGILSEISNSIQPLSIRKRASISIYEDDPDKLLLDRSLATPNSLYHDASSRNQSPLSPLESTTTSDEASTMRLREISSNEQRPMSSFSSPLTFATKGRRRTKGMRQTSFEAAEYIDHIEKQLEQVKAAMHSPSTGKPIHVKMKALKAENARLQQTVEDLESSFEAQVKSSLEHMTAGEAELRRKVRGLEEDLSERILRIEELEYEHEQARLDQGLMDTLKATIERLEGEKKTLEDANSSIEKRNEILTEMLAFSPTKSHHGFELASPLRHRGQLTRPASTMGCLTRFPSSPSSKHESRSSQIVNSPTAISPEGYFSSRNVLELELEHPCNEVNDADSGLGESCSMKSPTTSSSRRSTLASQVSTSPSAWGLPFPISAAEGAGTVRPIQKRKPRRFMTGSTQLKSLLLPSMAAESTGLTSPRSPTRSEAYGEPAGIHHKAFSYKVEGLLSSSNREVSQESIDPTISFLSNPTRDINFDKDGSSPLTDPSLSSVDSASLAYELDDIAFLYGGLGGDIEDENYVDGKATNTTDSPEERILCNLDQSEGQRAVYADKLPVDANQPSSAKQDEFMTSNEALMQTQHLKEQLLSVPPNPRKRRRKSSMPQSDTKILASSLADVPSSAHHVEVSPSNTSNRRRPASDARRILEPEHEATQARLETNPATPAALAAYQGSFSLIASPSKPSRSTAPLEVLQRQKNSTMPLAALTIRNIYGALSRYTTYVRDFKRDPFALARRVIANAWCSNWKRVGRLSWWVLGIFVLGRQRDDAGVAGWDWDHYDGEVVANGVCCPDARESGAVETTKYELPFSPDKRKVGPSGQYDSRSTRMSGIAANLARPGSEEKPAGLGKSLYLWGKFSVAIMLAVGGAVWKGPGEMLKGCDMPSQMNSCSRMSSNSTCGNSHPVKSQDSASNGSPVLGVEDGAPEPLEQDGVNTFPTATSSGCAQVPRSPSTVFTFGLPNEDHVWGCDEDNLDLLTT